MNNNNQTGEVETPEILRNRIQDGFRRVQEIKSVVNDASFDKTVATLRVNIATAQRRLDKMLDDRSNADLLLAEQYRMIDAAESRLNEITRQEKLERLRQLQAEIAALQSQGVQG